MDFTWTQWFVAFAPVGILTLVAVPLVTYWLHPPEVKRGSEVPAWARRELAKLGGITRRELGLGALVLVFYFTHYLFASVTAHVTALLPVMLAAGATIPGMDVRQFALPPCLTLGIMGVLAPYANGPSPAYQGSGYLPSKGCRRPGAVFGLIFIVLFLVVTLPWPAIAWGR